MKSVAALFILCALPTAAAARRYGWQWQNPNPQGSNVAYLPRPVRVRPGADMNIPKAVSAAVMPLIRFTRHGAAIRSIATRPMPARSVGGRPQKNRFQVFSSANSSASIGDT
jgi:hypothetical protein